MHYYEILKHKAGFDEGTSYWEKLLARYLAATGGGKIHTTLPITFASTSWKLAGWTIYGNDDIGKNLLEITATSQTINGVTFTINKEAGTITANGTASAEAMFGCWVTLPAGRYLENGCPSGGSDDSYDVYMWNRATNTRTKKWDGGTYTPSDYGRGVSQEVLLTEETQIRYSCRIRNGYNVQNVVFKPMIRLPDTSATFEPYQIGVGQRTVVQFTDWENGSTSTGVAQIGHSYSYCKTNTLLTTRRRSVDIVPVTDGTVTLDITSGYQAANIYFDKDGLYIGNTVTYHNDGYVTTLSSDVKYVAFVIKKSDGSAFTDGDSWNVSIAYSGDKAYKIPLTISQTGQTDKNYNIYIGNSPLTEGQTVSNTQEIEVFEGENTIDTTLYNKPVMEIKYE